MEAEAEVPTGLEAQVEPTVLPTLSLNVLLTVQTAQSIHGLKHSDYLRYRQYCGRRLRRLYKSLKFLHGRGRYQKKRLEAAAIKDVRYLHIPLVCAERAWSYAMELKNQLEQKSEPRKRQHLVRRLAKAAAHAQDLLRLAGDRCDARSSLEADAYAALMGGNVLLERESDWEGALARFLRARKLLEELAKVGSFEQQGVCRHFLDQVEPTIRYCNYQISRKGGAAPDPSALLELEGAAGPGMDILQSKLASLAAEAQAQQAGATSSLSWQGESYPIREEKIRIPIHNARELESQLADSMDAEGAGAADSIEARLALYDRTINAYNEARTAVKAAMQLGSGGADSEAVRSELVALDRAVRGTVLGLTLARGLSLARDAAARLRRGQERALTGQKAKDKERPGRAEDVVRLYDTLLANVGELNELAAELGGARGEALMDACAAQAAQYQAARCLYVAHSYLAAGGKAAEAAALFQRAQERCRQARDKYEECAKPDAEGVAEVAALAQQAAAWRSVALADLGAEEARAKEGAVEGIQGLTLDAARAAGSTAGAKRAAEGYLEDSLEEWEEFVGEGRGSVRVARVPPKLRLVAARPIVLDAALNYIKYPSLEHRLPQKAPQQQGAAGGSMVSRLFGWGR
ncbi:hypothetical protein N2152v2_007878 [Parachlorella kessleri]